MVPASVSETKYSCSVGYSYDPDNSKTVDVMLKESDEMMYAEKASYYLAKKKAQTNN